MGHGVRRQCGAAQSLKRTAQHKWYVHGRCEVQLGSRGAMADARLGLTRCSVLLSVICKREGGEGSGGSAAAR